MKFLIFIALLSAIMVIKRANSMSLASLLLNPLTVIDDDPHTLHKLHEPELVRISIKRLTDNDDEMNGTNAEGRQIPVISDIERIKKVIEIIEFVGDKVGDIIDKLEVPQQSTDYYDERKATENPQVNDTQ